MGVCLLGIKIVSILLRSSTLQALKIVSFCCLCITCCVFHIQVTEPADRLTARIKSEAHAPLSEVAKQKLLESDGLRKAANKTVDAIRVGAGNVYEAAAALGSFQGKYPVGQQDLLVAFPADEAHVPLVQAGRQWHKVFGSHSYDFTIFTVFLASFLSPICCAHMR